MNEELLKLLTEERQPSKFGHGLFVRTLSPEERDTWSSDYDSDAFKASPSKFMAKYLSMAICDRNGDAVMSEAEALVAAGNRRISGKAFHALFDEAMEVNRLAESAMSKEKKGCVAAAASEESSPEPSA